MSREPAPPAPDAAALRRAGVEQAVAASDVHAALRAVDVLAAQHDDDGACEALARMRQRWPAEPRVALRLLDTLRRLGDAQALREVARELGRQRWPSSDLHFALGAWAEGEGALASAARAFARAVRRAPDEAEPVVRLARVLRRAGRPDLAERVARRALERHPEEASLHAALGYAFVDVRRPLAAATAFRAAVRLEPSWSVYRADLAGALVLAERWREAAEAAQAAVQADPRSERALSALALACGRLGKRDIADRAYRQALAVAPNPSRAHGNYGLFLATDPAKLLEAGRHLRTALEAHPDWNEVREALAGLAEPGR